MAPEALPLPPAEGLTRHFPPAVHQGSSTQLEFVGKVDSEQGGSLKRPRHLFPPTIQGLLGRPSGLLPSAGSLS